MSDDGESDKNSEETKKDPDSEENKTGGKERGDPTESKSGDPEHKQSPESFADPSTDGQKNWQSSYVPDESTGEGKLFGSDRLLHEDQGRSLPRWDAQGVEEFSGLFCTSWGGIITAEKQEEALEVAAYASHRRRHAHRYSATHADVVTIGWERLESGLLNRPHPTCYILEYWTWSSCLGIETGWSPFINAIRALEGSKHSIILCLDPDTWNYLIDKGKTMDGLPLYKRKAEPAKADPDDDAEVQTTYRNIFTPGGKDLRDIMMSADRQIIGRTLVQLVLLFPDLSTATYERLLKATLADRSVLVTPAEGTSEEYRPPALILWSGARHHFLDEAGLDRRTMAFKSKELEQKAEEMAWDDEQAMFDIFAAVSREGPLFGDLTDAGERELNLAYLNAAVVMADRAPSSFGPKWLEALVTDLHKQVRLRIPDLAGEYPELMPLLVALADNRQNILNRFTERVALLADYLIDAGKGALVTDLLDRLRRNCLHDISLRIISRIRRISDEERISSLKSLLNYGDRKTKAAALRGFAVEYLEDPETKIGYLHEVRSWLENEEHAYNTNLRPAALAFPAVFLEICHSSLFSKNRPTITADLLFNLIGESPPLTVLDWLAESVMRKGFGTSAANYMPEIETPAPDIFLLAMTLYHLAAMPGEGHTEILRVARKIRGSYLLRISSQLPAHWRNVAEYWRKEEKKTIGSSSKADTKLAVLAKRLNTVCRDLITGQTPTPPEK